MPFTQYWIFIMLSYRLIYTLTTNIRFGDVAHNRVFHTTTICLTPDVALSCHCRSSHPGEPRCSSACRFLLQICYNKADPNLFVQYEIKITVLIQCLVLTSEFAKPKFVPAFFFLVISVDRKFWHPPHPWKGLSQGRSQGIPEMNMKEKKKKNLPRGLSNVTFT